MLNDLEQRVVDAVAAMSEGGEPDPARPAHGTAGAVKWLADNDGPGGSPRFEGGYVCYCGKVFARYAGDGGQMAALMAFMTHEANP